MKKVKVTLHLHDEVEMQLAKLKNLNIGISEIVNDYFLKGVGRPKTDGLAPLVILSRAYAYHKRVHNIEYTKSEFVEHFQNDKKFNKIYRTYMESNFDKQEMPSFKKAKKLKDVKVLPYKKVMKRSNAKSVTRDYYGEITEYQSIRQAAIDLGLNTNVLKNIIKSKGCYRGDENDKLYYT